MFPYQSLNDQELADLLKDGDAAAFKCIYDKFWLRLYTAAARRLSNEEAEEVVQDVFLNLWKRRDTFELKVNFENYLAVAVKFEVFKHRAAKVKQQAFEQKLIASQDPAANRDWREYDVVVLMEQLEYAIRALPSKCRMVFTMSRETELTNKQIANHLDISEKAVEKHITTALKHLRSRFGHYLIFIFILQACCNYPATYFL